MNQNHIRNIVIIAHVDHGKSTLADRLLEITGAVPARKLREQFLDQMELEQERGITIKMQPVRMTYRPQIQNSDNHIAEGFELSDSGYVLNLIDTPGHVDFSYEVSRSLAAVEGAILLVDGAQGVQAQTLANLSLAKEGGLFIIGAVNKVDLDLPDIDALVGEIAALINVPSSAILKISGKTGQGVDQLLEELVLKVPPPINNSDQPMQALIFDSHYDSFRGAIAYVRLKAGTLRKGDRLQMASSKLVFDAMETGYFKPAMEACAGLASGEIGYIATGLKQPGVVKVGDTILHADLRLDSHKFAALVLPGYRQSQPLLFAGFYPSSEEGFALLSDALSKLKLNDAALTYSQERQATLGKGFRVGFLGALHMEIVKERLTREYGIEPLVTMPSVRYRLVLKGGQEVEIETPQDLPTDGRVLEIHEPWANGEMLLPSTYLNALLGILRDSRGNAVRVETLERERVMVHFEAPLAELVVGFYDRIKSASRGYASAAYALSDWRKGDLVKLEVLIAEESVETLARIVPRQAAERIGRATVAKLKDLLPREVFAVPLQAATGGRIIARETIPAMRKDVTGHLYGGDRTRKMKLWKKQQAGKKRLAKTGRVTIKPEVFFELLKMDSSS